MQGHTKMWISGAANQPQGEDAARFPWPDSQGKI